MSKSTASTVLRSMLRSLSSPFEEKGADVTDRTRAARWRVAADVLDLLRRQPGSPAPSWPGSCG